MTGKSGDTLCCHSPPWEKSRMKRFFFPQSCASLGEGWHGWGETAFAFFNTSTLRFFGVPKVLELFKYLWCPVKVFSPGLVVKVSVSMGGMSAEISYSSILLTSFPILIYSGFYHDFFLHLLRLTYRLSILTYQYDEWCLKISVILHLPWVPQVNFNFTIYIMFFIHYYIFSLLIFCSEFWHLYPRPIFLIFSALVWLWYQICAL